MPHGFFTVEQWNPSLNGGSGEWIPILHLDASQSLTKATQALSKRNKEGLYRIVQTQRCIWAEVENGELRLHGSHVGSVESLAELAELFHREGGRRPVEKARRERAESKAKRPR
jgi:hypothetical protein